MLPTDHWIDTSQGRLFARCWAPGEGALHGSAAILLFHDSLGCVDIWRDFPERLAHSTQRQVIAYDHLGFGRSSSYPGPLAADFMHAEAMTNVPALCAQLGLGSLIPFGHSVGGAMAVATAVHQPQRCSAAITMSAQAFVEDRTLAGIREARDAFQMPEQVERLARYHGEKARWVLDAWIETWLAPGFATWNLDADLDRVHCPLLALHGDRDEYGSRLHPERIAARTAGPSEFIIIEDCGHVPQREQPEQVFRATKRFLATEEADHLAEKYETPI